MGFGIEILFLLVLGLLMLGPKRMPAIIKNVARAKAQFESATRNFKSQLRTEPEGQLGGGDADFPREGGRQ